MSRKRAEMLVVFHTTRLSLCGLSHHVSVIVYIIIMMNSLRLHSYRI